MGAAAAGAVLALAACGTQAPPPAPEQPPLEPGLRWSSDFESGTTDDWRFVHEDAPGRIEVVDNPSRDGRQAVRLTGDGTDLGDDEPVRAQLDGPVLFQEGDEAYIGFSTFFPEDIPAVPDDGWFVFFQFHGAPFGESPPLAFELVRVDGQQYLGLARGEQYGFDTPWLLPLERGRWIDFTVHVGFSSDEALGFVELWVDGEPQRFADGSTRLESATILDAQNEGLFPIATVYYKAGSIDGPVTLYHDAVRVADSYEVAAPRSAGR